MGSGEPSSYFDLVFQNERVERHYSHVLGITHNVQNVMFQRSAYQQARLKNLIRAGFGGIANIPAKSIAFLVTPYDPLDANDDDIYLAENLPTISEIASRANDLMGYNFGQSGAIYSGTVKKYYEDAILNLTFFGKKGKKSRSTGLAEDETGSMRGTYYHKTLDGFLLGDIFAYLGIHSSNIADARSGYKIWGKADTSGESNSQEMTLMLLYWLYERGGEGRVIDFVREVFGYEGGNQSEYIFLSRRIAQGNLTRLNESNILRYESVSSKQSIEIALRPGVTFDKVMSGNVPVYIYQIRACLREVIDYLHTHETGTNKEIEAETNYSRNTITNITKFLRDFGHANVIQGRANDDQSLISLLPQGLELLGIIDPVLKLIGWHDTMPLNRDKGTSRLIVKYNMLKQIVKPNLPLLWRMREDKLSCQNEITIREMAIIANEKHCVDNPLRK